MRSSRPMAAQISVPAAYFGAARLAYMAKMIMQSPPAWNSTEPQMLSVFCIIQPQAIANGKSTATNWIVLATYATDRCDTENMSAVSSSDSHLPRNGSY